MPIEINVPGGNFDPAMLVDRFEGVVEIVHEGLGYIEGGAVNIQQILL